MDRRKKAKSLSRWIGSGGELGEAPPEWFVYEASKFLGMSFVELDGHPDKHELMRMAFTLKLGIQDGEAAIREQMKQKRGG